jgi:hypothetical protein
MLTLAARHPDRAYGTAGPAPRPSPWQRKTWTWLSAAPPCTT